MTYKEQLKKLSFKQRILVHIIVTAIKHRKFLWLFTIIAEYLGTHLKIDKETKTWSISSSKAFNPANQNINYNDIEHIHLQAVKKLLGDNKILLDGDIETRNSEGKFRGFIVESK